MRGARGLAGGVLVVLMGAALVGCSDQSRPPAGVARANGNGCYDLADAVAAYNRAFRGATAGTATVTDVEQDLAVAVRAADRAAVDLDAGGLKDQAQALSTFMGRARVSIDQTGTVVSIAADDPDVEDAFQRAAGFCPGILK